MTTLFIGMQILRLFVNKEYHDSKLLEHQGIAIYLENLKVGNSLLVQEAKTKISYCGYSTF